MVDHLAELKEALNKIRQNGIGSNRSADLIVKEMLTYLMDYRKNHTLSVQDLESLIKENKQLTETMLNRLKKIQKFPNAAE
jgi:hypothetical protein